MINSYYMIRGVNQGQLWFERYIESCYKYRRKLSFVLTFITNSWLDLPSVYDKLWTTC